MNISLFYHRNLIKLYVTILKNLDIKIHKQPNLPYFLNNFKDSYSLIFDNKQMILADDNYLFR